jgi:hypothetical protein
MPNLGVGGVVGARAWLARGWGNVVGDVVVVFADELAPVAVEVALLEFVGSGVDRFEKGGGDAGEGGGAFGVETAFGNGVVDAGEGLRESGGGDEVADERFTQVRSGFVGFAEVAELAFVVEAVAGFLGFTKHAALAAVGKSESTQRRAVFGVVGRHRILQIEKLSCKRKSPAEERPPGVVPYEGKRKGRLFSCQDKNKATRERCV